MLRKNKWLIWGVVLLVSLALLVGCGDNNGENNGNNNGEEEAADNGTEEATYPMTFVDDTGQEMEITAEPQRIISLTPNLTETLFALELGDRVVGVSDECNYPEEALEVDQVGSAWGLNLEAILALEPDLVVASGQTPQDAVDQLRENNLTVVVFAPRTLDDIEEMFRQVATVAGVPENGVELANEMSDGREAFSQKVAAEEGERPTVFVMIDENLYTVGSGEFMNEMINNAGGINVAEDIGAGWPQISEEEFLQIDPEVIISSFTPRDDILANSNWQGINAVQNGRVYNINDDVVTRPGPRIVEGLEELYNAFYE
ncbi:ABC transporter substrate-binding protein [Dethiobacter alkaliphilus]|uniref:Periplasmic binding protein n=1 Tax=Dethiobacter alkaliphilus AHT 1 TaxID=555088 RepID=C0GDY0_DETAL|nr:cobalamin-binding protein [Dethiobacter alkaliphilus]EEG78274.1 periplasmic binding protein [Dethiobacter alkaliphilus AHT 1]